MSENARTAADSALVLTSHEKASLALGVDLGGTKLLAGLTDRTGRTLAAAEEPTRHGADAPVLAQIADIADRMCREIGADRAALRVAAVGVPGAVSPISGHVSLASNLDLPAGENLAALLAERLACPVRLENDVNVAAFGEARTRPGVPSLVFVSFGTGVGMGLVLGGHLVRGARGAAGEIAYLPVGADALALKSSPSGLFEDYVGSPGIRARYGADVPVAEIFARAAAGEAQASATIDATARIAAIGLAAVQALFDPDMIVLGGSIGANPAFSQPTIRHLAALLPLETVVETSTLGRRAGLAGALALAATLLEPKP